MGTCLSRFLFILSPYFVQEIAMFSAGGRTQSEIDFEPWCASSLRPARCSAVVPNLRSPELPKSTHCHNFDSKLRFEVNPSHNFFSDLSTLICKLSLLCPNSAFVSSSSASCFTLFLSSKAIRIWRVVLCFLFFKGKVLPHLLRLRRQHRRCFRHHLS